MNIIKDLEITHEEIEEFRNTWRNLFVECCYILKIDIIAEWLNGILKQEETEDETWKPPQNVSQSYQGKGKAGGK